MPSSPEDEQALAIAYEQRNVQLYEARSALAEAVATLTVELGELRKRTREQSEAIDSLQNEIEVQRNMKVVRWTRWPRQFVYGLRERRQ